MVAIPSRHKSLVLLAGSSYLQVLLLAVQIKRGVEGTVDSRLDVGAASPVRNAPVPRLGWVRDIWRHYFGAAETRRKRTQQIPHENDALKLQKSRSFRPSRGSRPPCGLAEFRQSHAGVP